MLVEAIDGMVRGDAPPVRGQLTSQPEMSGEYREVELQPLLQIAAVGLPHDGRRAEP